MRYATLIGFSLLFQGSVSAQSFDDAATEAVETGAAVVEQEVENASETEAQAEVHGSEPHESQVSDAQAAEQSLDATPTEDVAQNSAQTWQGMANGDQSGVAQADDKRIVLQERGFSIVPPAGWEVTTDHPTLSVFMQTPAAPGLRYRRNIQVASYNGPRYIDEITAKEFETEIVKKFESAPANIQNYRIRNHMKIDLADGRPALLFYTEMVVDGVDLMQAHILVSSPERHFVTIFTDVREHFEDDAASAKFFAEAWASMVSMEISGTTPLRFAWLHRTGFVVAGLVVFFIAIWGLRQWRARRALSSYTEDLSDGTLSGNGSSNISELGTISSARTLPTQDVPRKYGKKSKARSRQEDLQPESSIAQSMPAVSGKSLLTTGTSSQTHHSSVQLPSEVPSKVSMADFSGFDDDDKAA